MRPFGIPQRHTDGCRIIVQLSRMTDRHAQENLDQADALLWPRDLRDDGAGVSLARGRERGPIWNPLARTIDAAKKYVVSSTWTGSIGTRAVSGDLGKAVQQLKRESGKGGRPWEGVKPPPALAELGLIDEYEIVVHPRLEGPADVASGYRPVDEAREPG
jgi:hypothetical protein